MKSKTKISKQAERKNNPNLVETILAAKKQEAWMEVASELSKPRRLRLEINLEKINSESKDGETIVVPGKVLSQGNMSKKITIVAMNFSDKAKEKILNSKGNFKMIMDEIKSNPVGKGIKILK